MEDWDKEQLKTQEQPVATLPVSRDVTGASETSSASERVDSTPPLI